ncbi:A24 family peptidase [Anaerovibrio sp. RM50]|uniref:prepilin peptidase n=1 Tax=Anaerovibrio sp. RM50 TaxID=1200557 RepID=UPI00047FA3B5|nr:A24 family peptidase [Anaerovibrio sp. RM50]
MMEALELIRKHFWEVTVLYLCITAGELFLSQSMNRWWIIPLFNITLVPLGILDYYYKRLFNGLVAVMGLIGLVICGLLPERHPGDVLIGAAVFGGVLFLIRYMSKESLGMGDVKLGAAAGIWLGPQASVTALYASFAIGGLYVVFYLLMVVMKDGVDSLWKYRKKAIPFGPFLAIGSSVGLIYGEEIIGMYLTLLCWTGAPVLWRL